MVPVVNRDAVPEHVVDSGDIQIRRRRLGAAAGTHRIGASHYVVAPGARAMPVHVHGDEEEIFYVLSGTGFGYADGELYPIGPGDAIVERAEAHQHTRLAGDGGLEFLAFGSGSDTGITFLPRANAMWCGPRWVPLEQNPFRLERAAGPLERPDTTVARPEHVVAQAEVKVETKGPGAQLRRLGRAGGAVKAGLTHVTLSAGASATEPHCHTLEEELYVVLEGAGTLRLGEATHPLGPGDLAARPPGTGVAHQVVAGDQGMTYLVYGTREPGDIVGYPRTGTVLIRGLGITLQI